MCYRTYFLLVVASHVHMNCLQDVNVIYTLHKNVFYAIRAPMYRAHPTGMHSCFGYF